LVKNMRLEKEMIISPSLVTMRFNSFNTNEKKLLRQELKGVEGCD
jgi:hypothetical protein